MNGLNTLNMKGIIDVVYKYYWKECWENLP